MNEFRYRIQLVITNTSFDIAFGFNPRIKNTVKYGMYEVRNSPTTIDNLFATCTWRFLCMFILFCLLDTWFEFFFINNWMDGLRSSLSIPLVTLASSALSSSALDVYNSFISGPGPGSPFEYVQIPPTCVTVVAVLSSSMLPSSRRLTWKSSLF